jgi:hypothetical protein
VKSTSILAACLLAAAASAQAQTVTLLTLIDPPAGATPSYALTFTATGTSSTLTDAGYQLPGFTHFTQNSVVDNGGGGNLLGQVWAFTPAASGSDTSQYNDGTSVNALNFGGVTIGSYDIYSQTFATTVGDEYTYSFNVSGFAGNPDGFYVTVSNASTSAVPEPGTLGLMMAGLGLVGCRLRKRAAR